MNAYKLEKFASRKCEHGMDVWCSCERKPITSQAVQGYIRRAKTRLKEGILYNPEWTPEGRNKGERYRWIEHPEDGLRLVGAVHEIGGKEDDTGDYIPRIKHTGWYVDNDQNETCHGEVYRLPARNGKPLFVPAVNDWNGNDGAILDFHSTTDSLADAVRWADSMAERIAESEREEQVKASAEMRVEELDGEIEQTISGVRALCRELRGKCDRLAGMDELKKLIRAEVKKARQSIRRMRTEQAKLKADPYSYQN